MNYALLAGMTVLAVLAARASAQNSLEVGPIRIQMIGPERTSTLTVRNSADMPTNLQIRTLEWSQSDGQDRYAPSTTLLASPPAVALKPGEAQVIRLVVEGMPPGGGERAFRVVIDQIPSAATRQGAAVRTSFRALVPVFVTASLQDQPKLRWEARRSGSQLMVTAINEGRARDRLVELTVTAGGARLGDATDGYVLAGARRTWTLPAPAAGARSVRISGEGEHGRVEADVPVTS